jgi:hypothetical protein
MTGSFLDGRLWASAHTDTTINAPDAKASSKGQHQKKK